MNTEYKELINARRYARRVFNELKHTREYRNAHDSHAAANALARTDKKYHLGFFGVEGFELDGYGVLYLNTGDTYALTICFFMGKFRITSWGDIVENFERGFNQ